MAYMDPMGNPKSKTALNGQLGKGSMVQSVRFSTAPSLNCLAHHQLAQVLPVA